MSTPQCKRVAIIGGGCAGVTAFYALQKSPHDVHLFEASPSLGGRVNTVSMEYNGIKMNLDTESPIFNATASPNLASLLRYLRISISATSMQFKVTDGIRSMRLGSNLLEDFAHHPALIFNLNTWRMLRDILRLSYMSVDLLYDRRIVRGRDVCCGIKSRTYFTCEGYSNTFYTNYLLPVLSTVWGSNARKILNSLSLRALIHTLSIHGLRCASQGQLEWRRIDEGAHHLLQTMARSFPSEKIHLRMRVQRVSQSMNKKFVLLMQDGQEKQFDHVIFAIPGYEILRLSNASLTAQEKEILQSLKTARHIAVLHSDSSNMSRSNQPRAASSYIETTQNTSWNRPEYFFDHKSLNSCVSHVVDTQQSSRLGLHGRLRITFNPFTPPDPQLVHGIWDFTDHEINTSTLQAQELLPSIQNRRGLSFCLRWTGRGFLEDAVTCGLSVAIEHLGADVPFDLEVHRDLLDADGLPQLELNLTDHLIRIILSLIRFYILVIEISLILLGSLRRSVLKARGHLRLKWMKTRT